MTTPAGYTATILLLGRGGSYPALSVALGERMGVIGALSIEIAAKQILLTKRRLNEILAKNSRQPLERVEKDAERDFWLSAADAKEYGLIDEVIVSKKAPDKKPA